jgi:hypothetical protein
MQVFGIVRGDWYNPLIGIAARDFLGHVLLDHHLLTAILIDSQIDEAEAPFGDGLEDPVAAQQDAGAKSLSGSNGGHHCVCGIPGER